MTTPETTFPCQFLSADGRAAAVSLNQACLCNSLNHDGLQRALDAGRNPSLPPGGLTTPPHLFSDSRVFVGENDLKFMADLIAAIERVIALPAWREMAFAQAPAIARYTPTAKGVFLGYDFHLGENGPQLIEINTNAGGALLNAKLLRAQYACGPGSEHVPHVNLEAVFFAMFRLEWRLARGDRPLRRIAIVDEFPSEQFLASEFELFRQLFEAEGISACVLDPRDLAFDGEKLHGNGDPIDLVYNRLTDFSLSNAQNADLHEAYLADAVLLTPHPQAHALFADKRNLVKLTNDSALQAMGVSEADRQLLASGIPRTLNVTPENAPNFWAQRKHYFFKPATGYGGKAAYRGDKLTTRVFAEIARGGYVAQSLVTPSERRVRVNGSEQTLKLDLRNYVYQGQIQLVSARLYQGQTTNFRTPGGGFAAVFPVSCLAGKKLCEREA